VRQGILGNDGQCQQQTPARGPPTECAQEEEPTKRPKNRRADMFALLVNGAPPIGGPGRHEHEGHQEDSNASDQSLS